MMFLGFGFLLALVAALFVLWPLLRKGGTAVERSESALAIFADQLRELDRDAERGLISGAEAKAARVEIERRMLAADNSRGAGRSKGASENPWVLLAAAALVPLCAAGIYTLTGNPGIQSQPFAERSAEREDAQSLDKLTAQLRARLEQEPDGGEARGWELLAGTYMNMGRYRDSAFAWSRLAIRPDATSAVFSQLAEALIAAENGIVTPQAQSAIDRAIELDPLNPAGTYYNALAVEQVGEGARAREMLLDRIAQESEPAPWMEVFLNEANRIGATLGLPPASLPSFPELPGVARVPSQEEIEAASEMSAEDRMDFIRSMVARLEERLEGTPDDLQGWLQLARARMVLGEEEKARDALERARVLTANLPEDSPQRQLVEEGLRQLSE
ncbi:MAG: c-type cytochrome biogenesis protein CcmI [Litoreibacter sp.]|nr:c-type cytochrome biogenesis protein CcmI [Litoreibacter sp.]